MNKICVRCKTGPVDKKEDDDRRILWMSCFYEMMELKIPFERELMYETLDPRDAGIDFYTLKVCKDCRSDWMRTIQYWWNHIPEKTSCGSGIYVRDFGANREITLEEYREKYDSEREPVRFINEPCPENKPQE
ncbi:MAG TPA: hypothetical protein VKR58_10045 [Aquella sp.]|nr:hypothetical protein [Aquella sp.]